MVAEPLRKLMLAAEGAGSLAGAGVLSGAAEHPVCGDRVEVDVRLLDGAIAELAWRAQGCPASMAVAAAAAAALRGHRPAGAALALRARLQALGDLAAHERHAEGLFLRALANALSGGG